MSDERIKYGTLLDQQGIQYVEHPIYLAVTDARLTKDSTVRYGKRINQTTKVSGESLAQPVVKYGLVHKLATTHTKGAK